MLTTYVVQSKADGDQWVDVADFYDDGASLDYFVMLRLRGYPSELRRVCRTEEVLDYDIQS